MISKHEYVSSGTSQICHPVKQGHVSKPMQHGFVAKCWQRFDLQSATSWMPAQHAPKRKQLLTCQDSSSSK
jgi:hypothetical protein